MSGSVRVYRVDVFTDTPGQGNPAGVVAAADGLSDPAMQEIAAALDLSETAFLLAPRDPSHDVFVRFFTPEREVPVCGHATLAAQAVRAAERGEREGRVVQGSPGARWEVRWSHDAGRFRATMVQQPVTFGDIVDGAQCRSLYAALGGARPALAPPPHILSTGHPKVVLPIGSVAELRALEPDMAALVALSARLGADGFFVFALTQHVSELTECRMFAPSIGVPEDPVNGSGHGPLAAYLVRYGLLARDGSDRASFVSRMGGDSGRRGLVHVMAELDGADAVRVHVGGDLVLAPPVDLPFPVRPGGHP